MNSKTEYANFGWLTSSIARLQGITHPFDLTRTTDQILADAPGWLKETTAARLKLYVSNRLASRIKVPNGH